MKSDRAQETHHLGLHDLPYLETGMSDFGRYPCGGLFVSRLLD